MFAYQVSQPRLGTAGAAGGLSPGIRSASPIAAEAGNNIRRIKTALASLLLALSCLVSAAPAAASSFQINPVLIELDADKGTALMTIENRDGSPVSVRLQARSWTQQGGEDVYGDASELIISPPIATIPAKGKQVVRIGQRKRGGPEERAYRVVVEEIPTEAPTRTGVMMALRFDLPMFAVTAKPETAELQWKASRDKAGRLTVEAANGGTTRTEILELGFQDASGKRSMFNGRVGVVLAKSSKRWTFDERLSPANSGRFTLIVRTSDGEKQLEVALQDL